MANPEQGPPAIIDHPSLYEVEVRSLGLEKLPIEPVQENIAKIASGEIAGRAPEILKKEEAIIGMNSSEQTDEFLRARRDLFLSAENHIQQEFEPLKNELAGKVAGYFSGDNAETAQDLESKLLDRVASTKGIYMSDSLGYGMNDRNSGAAFSSENRQITVKTEAVVDSLLGGAEKNLDSLIRVELAHELMHGFFATAEQGDKNAMNGLQTTHYEKFEMFEHGEKQGTWINEAVLEDFRQELMQTDELRYEPGVAVLRLMDQLKPGIKEQLRVGAFNGHGKGELVGQVEEIFGPLGIENIENVLGEVRNATDVPKFTDDIAALLPEESRANAKEFLQSSIESMLAGNGKDIHVPNNAQEATLFKGLQELGWKNADTNARFDKIKNITPEELVKQIVGIHELVAPDKAHTPVDYTMKSVSPEGEVRKKFANPEQRFGILEAAISTVHELCALDDGSELAREKILQRASNILALSLAEVHAFEDGNGRTLRTIAQLVRFGYETKETGEDMVLVAGNRPNDGFRVNSFHPRGDINFEDVIKAAAGLDIPLSETELYKKTAEEAFSAPYGQ